jgi:subtilisin family serine protease
MMQDQVIQVEAVQTQLDPPNWGLDMIDNPSLPLDAKYNYEYTGSGVDVLILDSGIKFDHEEFEGRATCGYNAIPNENCSDFRGKLFSGNFTSAFQIFFSNGAFVIIRTWISRCWHSWREDIRCR